MYVYIYVCVYILKTAWEIYVKEVVSCILIGNLNHNLIEFGQIWMFQHSKFGKHFQNSL